MKKLFALLFFVSAVVVALNFSGHQSLNGIPSTGVRDTSIFKAITPDYYFVNGQLTLPSGSSVVAIVSKNGSAVYTGVTGAKGFQVRGLKLETNDEVTVRLRSSNSVDQKLNAVRGEVYYGNGM